MEKNNSLKQLKAVVQKSQGFLLLFYNIKRLLMFVLFFTL